MSGYGTAAAAALAAAYGPSVVAISVLQSEASECSVPLEEMARLGSLRLDARVVAFLFGRRLADALSLCPVSAGIAEGEVDSGPDFRGAGVLKSLSQSSHPFGNCHPHPSLIARSSSPSKRTYPSRSISSFHVLSSELTMCLHFFDTCPARHMV